jgi:Fic family protein
MPLSLKPWNWQVPGWPDFVWWEEDLRPLEAEFLRRSGVHVGSFSHLHSDEQDQLRSELLSDEALLTSRIEGEILDRDSLQSSIRRLFGLESDQRTVRPAESGISELMLEVYQNHGDALDRTRLFAWHRMVMRGRWDLKTVGAFPRPTIAPTRRRSVPPCVILRSVFLARGMGRG